MGNAIKGHDGVMPVLAMKDTVYMSDMSGHIVSLLDKQFIVAGQAPEQFMYGKYLKANEDLDLEGRIDAINGATETAILAGMDVITIPGYEKNYKITTSEDLARFCEKNNESMEIN